jgi:hypothetical protein
MFAMISDGWILRNKAIWHKPNSMPGSQKDRLTTSWEYLYFFVKNSNPVLWRNRETGEWRDTRPTKAENYPWGGMYYNEERNEFRWDKPPEAEKDNWVKLQPLWMSFDYYFELDAIRQPHKTQSLERYQRGVNLDRPAVGKSAEVGPMQQYPRYPQWFGEMFPPDEDYKGKFDDIGKDKQYRRRDTEHQITPTEAPNRSTRDWRAEAAKKGQLFDQPVAHQGGGNTGLGKHHGSSHDGRAGMDNLTKHDQAVGRTDNVSYTDPLHTKDYSPKGRNPGDVLTERQQSIISHFEQKGSGGHYLYGGLESPEGVHEHPLGKNPGDTIKATTVRHKSWMSTPGHPYTHEATGKPQNPGDYWEITTQAYKGAHFAVYPEKLCEMPIKACSRVGDVVLDPFAGSGTTAVVAKRLGRKAILIDCVESYCAISKERISKVEYQPELELK